MSQCTEKYSQMKPHWLWLAYYEGIINIPELIFFLCVPGGQYIAK